MQITHEEARKLIQFNADTALSAPEMKVLSTHLKDCASCRAYATEIKDVESALLFVMKRQWYLQPPPLSIDVITSKKGSRLSARNLLAIRTAMLSAVFIMFIFSVWQFTLSGELNARRLPVGVPLAPTPSAQSTSTKLSFENCENVLYIVQADDTLASIADQFSLAKEDILMINGLTTENITAMMNLKIPVCNLTPTGTAEGPATLTSTHTPIINLITSTPGGRY